MAHLVKNVRHLSIFFAFKRYYRHVLLATVPSPAGSQMADAIIFRVDDALSLVSDFAIDEHTLTCFSIFFWRNESADCLTLHILISHSRADCILHYCCLYRFDWRGFWLLTYAAAIIRAHSFKKPSHPALPDGCHPNLSPVPTKMPYRAMLVKISQKILQNTSIRLHLRSNLRHFWHYQIFFSSKMVRPHICSASHRTPPALHLAVLCHHCSTDYRATASNAYQMHARPLQTPPSKQRTIAPKRVSDAHGRYTSVTTQIALADRSFVDNYTRPAVLMKIIV
jgi:hypothetical protein